ncbi:MAG: BTAD domain-containing putative transcriptional regulator [Chloroflexota bacterium]
MPNQPVKPEYATGVSPDEVGAPLPVPSGEHGEQPSAPDLSIIASKIEPPIIGGSVLTRPRLVGWLDQQKRARVMLVSAEAGYGKSTLLGDFSGRTDSTCLWYRLETSDGDWITFLSHLVAAVRRAFPGFGRPTEALLRHLAAMGPSREVVVGTFLSDLGTLGSASLILILDDYHLVEDSEDVRVIMARLLERAPATMRFVLAGRGKPNLPLGRLAAQGRVAELTTSDLRFTRSEIEELFGSKYGQPLGRETCDIVERRTEGWAASLQLVSASIAASRPSEVGQFIEALSGAQGPIYDFLAEEVLSRLSPLTQRVLIHASLIDRVTPRLVSAALSATADPVDVSGVEACMRDVEVLGLLSHQADAATGVRIHPLLRQFLEHQLAQHSSPVEIRSMHHAVARCAEEDDWLVASKHFALAGQPDEAMRVLGAAASQALGTGAWGAAAEVVASMPDTPPPPAVEVIKARALTSSGRPDLAITALAGISEAPLNKDELTLVSLARASALQMAGQSDELWREVQNLGALGHTDPVVSHLADTWLLIRSACQGGSIADARRSLDQLVSMSSTSNLGHYAGIALHNSSTAALSQADYPSAARLAIQARSALVESPPDASIRPSTLSTQAIALAEMGQYGDARMLSEEASSAPDAHPDALADGSYLAAVAGERARAKNLDDRLRRLMSSGPTQVGAVQQARVARVAILLSDGDFREAASQADRLATDSMDELDGVSRSAYLRALTSTLLERRNAPSQIAEAIEASQRQESWRWELRARTVEAAANADESELGRLIAECGELSGLAILEMADLLGASLGAIGSVPTALSQSIARHPSRWRPILLRQLNRGSDQAALVAARLLTAYGTREDASQLAAFERKTSMAGRKDRLSRELVRRVSPTLRVHDLGRTMYEVVGGEVASSAARRKAPALLLFLVTRPKQTATREQIMEELWPNQGPSSAINSLHQTLHFVRRDIAPWQDDGATADYVPLNSELIYLDPELVQVDSVAFLRQSTEALISGDLGRAGPSIVRLYTGRFAPEFEYEDWAADWRILLHGKFLHLCQATVAALLGNGRVAQAIDVLSRALEIDGLAHDLREMLIRTLTRAGATDAAASHYRHYAILMERDLGVRAPPIDEILAGGDELKR